MLKFKEFRLIDLQDWDNLVKETYGKPYRFQQQEGCQEKGIFELVIPSEYENESEMHDSVPEVVNGDEMGVKFEVWLERDPKQLLKDKPDCSDFDLKLFWSRNFYPSIYTLADDLYKKGLIEAGNYLINIDW